MGTYFPDINTENNVYLDPEYDENNNLICNKEIVDHLLSHVLSVETGRRGIDSSVKNYENIIITKDQIYDGISSFNRNYGEFCDGVARRLESETIYFKFTSNIPISVDDGIRRVDNKQDLFKILKLKDRCKLNMPSFTLYVNRKKVPDELIYILMTPLKTDILFPLSCLKSSLENGELVYNDTEIYIEKKIYPKYRYINRYIEDNKSNAISFELDESETYNCKINSKTVLLFVNGILGLTEKTVTKKDKTVSIVSNDIRPNTDIEVVIDSDINIINTVSLSNTSRCYFNISESDIDPKVNYLYGAIPKKNCYFFINGARYFNNDIKQVGRMNFIYDAEQASNYVCTLIYTDRGYIDESTRYIYGDDYYLSNFIGVENVSKLLNGEKVNTYINDPELNLDFHKIMNLNGKRYSLDYAKEINRIVDEVSSYEAKVKEILKISNHLIRDFMNLYGRKEIYKTIVIGQEDEIEEFYNFSFQTKKDVSIRQDMKYYYIIDINGYHINDTDIEIEDNYIYDNIKIKGSCFKKGINKVHIKEFKYNISGDKSIEYKILTKDNIIDMDGIYISKIEKLNSVKEVSDLICLEYSTGQEGIYYDPDLDYGWVAKNDVSFQINDDGTISIIFETLPKEDKVCIYSKRFALKYTKTIERDIVDLSDITIPIRPSSVDNVPIIPVGGYMVYLNDTLLFNGIDYVFRHPGNYDIIGYTSLGLKRRVKMGDVISIYFNEVKNEIIGRSNDVLSKEGIIYNKYGLIYFGKLQFPYSPRYIDLYINGKFIHPSEIDILSDKLIRVPEVHNPMFDIYAESSLSADPTALKKFFTYTNTELEDAISNWFVDFDFSTLVDPTDESLGNKVYESFDDNVDSVGKIPNPIYEGDIEEITPTRFNLLENAYLIWLKSNEVKTLMSYKNIRKEVVKYFNFYTEESSLYDRRDIVVSVNTKLFKDICLNKDKYPIKLSDRLRKVLVYLKTRNLSTGNAFEILRDDLSFSNIIYPRDFPKVIGSGMKTGLKGKSIVIGGVSGKIYYDHPEKNETEVKE